MAVTLLAAELEEAIKAPADVAVRLLPVVTLLVERYAPDADGDVQNEAAIRCAGWLAEQPMAARMSGKVGDMEAAYATASVSALRHSGAMALLSPWKVRRGGAIG